MLINFCPIKNPCSYFIFTVSRWIDTPNSFSVEILSIVPSEISILDLRIFHHAWFILVADRIFEIKEERTKERTKAGDTEKLRNIFRNECMGSEIEMKLSDPNRAVKCSVKEIGSINRCLSRMKF